MSNQNTGLKEILAKAVASVVDSKTGAKSKGVVIATIVRDVPIINIEPFTS